MNMHANRKTTISNKTTEYCSDLHCQNCISLVLASSFVTFVKLIVIRLINEIFTFIAYFKSNLCFNILRLVGGNEW